MQYLTKSVVLKAEEVIFISSMISTVMSTLIKVESSKVSFFLNSIDGSASNLSKGMLAESIGSHFLMNLNFYNFLEKLYNNLLH